MCLSRPIAFLSWSSPPPPLLCCPSIVMARYSASRVLLALLLALLVGVAAAGPTDAHRGDGKRRVWRVVKEHLDALNACDIRRLMAQHPYVGRGGWAARNEWGGRLTKSGRCVDGLSLLS